MKRIKKTEISVVIPTKDEGPNTERTINEIKPYLKNYKVEYIIPSGDKESKWGEAFPFYNAADAIMYGLRHTKGKYILTSDADDTYPAYVIPQMIRLMKTGKYEMVSASRTGKIEDGAHPFLNRLANKILAGMIRLLFGIPCTDPTSGLRMYKGDFFKRYKIRSDMSFWVDTILSSGRKYSEVIIGYRKRKYGKSKLNRFEFAFLLVVSIIRHLRRKKR